MGPLGWILAELQAGQKSTEVESCLPAFWGSNRMELPNSLQALYGVFGSQEHPSSGNQDPSPPLGLLEKESFTPKGLSHGRAM